MVQEDKLTVGGSELARAWQESLPACLNESDSADVQADGADPQVLRIHIDTAGHSKYSFDFVCTYVDSREVRVELADVEKDGVHIDEHQETVQQLIEDYVRHIHECAQGLQELTHA